MAFYRKGLFVFLWFDYFMMFIYECNGCTYSSSNEINICSAGSTTGMRFGIRNNEVPTDQIVKCVCDLHAQSPTNINFYFDGPGYDNCGTRLYLNPRVFSCHDGSSSFVLPTATRLYFEKQYAVNITCYKIGEEPPEGTTKFFSTMQPTLLQSTTSNSPSSAFPSTNLRTSPTSTQTSKPPTTTTTTLSSLPTHITTPLTKPSTLQSHHTSAKTSTREPKDPDSSPGTTPVLESNITKTKTFSTTAIVLISIGFGLFVTVTVPVVIILALKCMRSCKQKVHHEVNVQMSNIGNNSNPETNKYLQTFTDTDSLRYESLQNRTADKSYTNLQVSTGNQPNHLQPLYVVDSSPGRLNENATTTTDNESHYENSSSQPLSINSSERYEFLNPRTGPLSNHCYSTLKT
ncbi:hypothetical protein MAR_027947 [Mya arenaria]|uniref:Uncharacterized protein n=1 Tax=Mya arenaria TaxID=6604 RepID=A0ABY7DC61_MYAAR|nr:hypothetical protein MAR_027947 [Mya arenaria]